MGQRRSKLHRHAAELLALRRAGATVAQLTRWLRIERDTAVAASTIGRWLDKAHARAPGGFGMADHFDAVAALDELRARDRELRFPRLTVSSIDAVGYHVLRLRAEGATIGECHRRVRDDHGLRRRGTNEKSGLADNASRAIVPYSPHPPSRGPIA